MDEKRDAISALEKQWDEGYAIAVHQLGKCYRDGIGAERDAEAAVTWFRRGAAHGLDCSEYALGKLLLEQGKTAEGIGWLARAAKQENPCAQYRLGKVYLTGEQTAKDVDAVLSYLGRAATHGDQYAQYTLGKLYLMGQDVSRDMDLAVQYLTQSAAQGNAYAQYFLDHKDDWQSASTGSAVLRMLHHMSRIFQDNAVSDSTYMGLQIDKKRRQEMQDKAVSFPVQPLDPVTPSPAKQEQDVFKRIQRKLLPHHRGQSVNPFPQIRIPTGDVDLIRSRKVT